MKTSLHKFSQKVLGETGLRVLSTFFVLLLARTVGAEDFGRYSTAMAYAAFCAVIVDLGTNSILVREIARYPAGRQAIASTSHLLKLMACVVAWFLLAGITYVMHFTPDQRRLTLCLGIVVIGYTLTEYFSALLNGLEEMGWEALLKILSRALALSFALLAIARHQPLLTIANQLAWGTLISYAACVLLVRQRFHSFGLSFNPPLLHSLLRTALPLFGSVIFWVLYDSQDILLLNYFHFLPRDIGCFSAAMKVIDVIRVYPILVMGVFFPVLSKLHVSDTQAFQHKSRRLSIFMFMSLSLLAAAIYLSSPMIIRTLYKNDFMPAALYLRLLTPALVLVGLNYTQVQILIAINREKVLLTAAWLACGVNLILAVILLPRFGVPGSCYAQLGSELAYFLFLRRAAARP